MKHKLIIIIFFFFIMIAPKNVHGLEEVKLENCTSLSNIWVEYKGEIKRIHLLGFESPKGELSRTIDDYVCNTLKSSSKIEIEYEGTTKDKYNRDLVNVYVDGTFFQEDLVKKGYGYVDNVRNYLKNVSNLCEIEKFAIKNKLGIWNYANIQDPYCKNSIEVSSEESEVKEVKENKKDYDIKYMILIMSGMLLLLMIMKRG